MMAGVKMQQFKGEFARVGVMTSSDEKVVKMIHDHAKKTIAEYDKWLAEQAKGG